jgi:type II secretory pathway component GspD/PulD (secretin)
MIKRFIPLFLAAALFAPVWASEGQQEPPPSQEVATNAETGLVTVASKGKDVRDVLFDLFSQSKKSFILEQNIRYTLYLNLADVEFDEALAIILDLAGLQSEMQNGIAYIGKKKTNPGPNPPAGGAKPVEQPKTAPLGKLTDDEVKKPITTRFSMTDLRAVFKEFEKQTGIKIEVDAKVPSYKIDAFLIDTSLKYGLDVVTTAAGLKWTKTDRKTILIELKAKA